MEHLSFAISFSPVLRFAIAHHSRKRSILILCHTKHTHGYLTHTALASKIEKCRRTMWKNSSYIVSFRQQQKICPSTQYFLKIHTQNQYKGTIYTQLIHDFTDFLFVSALLKKGSFMLFKIIKIIVNLCWKKKKTKKTKFLSRREIIV